MLLQLEGLAGFRRLQTRMSYSKLARYFRQLLRTGKPHEAWPGILALKISRKNRTMAFVPGSLPSAWRTSPEFHAFQASKPFLRNRLQLHVTGPLQRKTKGGGELRGGVKPSKSAHVSPPFVHALSLPQRKQTKNRRFPFPSLQNWVWRGHSIVGFPPAKSHDTSCPHPLRIPNHWLLPEGHHFPLQDPWLHSPLRRHLLIVKSVSPALWV